MRILNIYFKNINSLEGESRINFEQPPFTDAGVFAITGPNGSGKSSILDAITLALYGETFRFNRPAEHVMTQNTSDCFSVLEFAINNEKYQASWRAKRAESGDSAINTEMKLVRSDTNEELATNVQAVNSRISEITGMNFRNFTRSVLLAQGDFAAFLNALDNERMDILEKIIGTDIYIEFKNGIANKIAQAQKRLLHLQQDLHAIPLMEAAKREALGHDLEDFNDQQRELKQEQEQLNQQQQTLSKVSEIKAKIVEQEKELEALNAQAHAVQQKVDQLAHSDDALLLKDDISTLEEKQQSLQQNKATLTTYQAELKLLQDELRSASHSQDTPADLGVLSFAEQLQSINKTRSEISLFNANKLSENDLWKSLETQLAERQVSLATVNTWLEEHSKDAVLVGQLPDIAGLKKLRDELTSLEGQQKTLAQLAKQAASSIKSNTALHEKDHKKIAELQVKLSEAESKLQNLAEGRRLEEIAELQADQQERVKNHQALVDLAVANQKLVQPTLGFFSLFRTKPVDDYDVDAIQQKLDQLKKELKLEETIKLTLDEAVFQNNLLKKMANDRQHLVDGKPCPLCGSAIHPYSTRPPGPTNVERVLHDQKEKLQSLDAAVTRQEHLLNVAKKMTEKNRVTNTQVQKNQAQWLTLSNKLNNANDLNINNVSLMKQLLTEENQQLKAITSLLNEYRSTQATIDKLKDLISKTEQHVETVQTSTQALDSNWLQHDQARKDLEVSQNKCQQDEKNLASQISVQLEAIGEKLPAHGKEDSLIATLAARRQEYQDQLARQKSLSDEIRTFTSKQKACLTAASNYESQIEQLSQQLQGEERVGLHLALVEKQKLISETEQRITEQTQDTQLHQQTLKEKIQTTAFDSVYDVNLVLQMVDQKANIEQQKTELDELIASKTLELQQTQALLSESSAQVNDTLSLEEIKAKLRSTSEKLQIAALEAQRAESLLAEQDNFQRKHDTITQQLQEQQGVEQQFIAEMAEIDAENGMVFRRRVQKQTIERLLSQTNTVLEKISGRYYLRQKPSEQGLALEVEDTYHNNIRRMPRSLSGGESFVVSLALALGLSELANNGKAVDSLFIDEGFGNLDSETLYTVISTLESLQAHGKTVGVISHVESVQKRFKAQLEIVKKPNGMGMLKKAS